MIYKFDNFETPTHYRSWLLALFFVLFCLFSPSLAASPAKQLNDEQTNEILFHIHAYYVDDLPLSDLSKSGLDELFAKLDPYSKYLNESELEAVFSAASGHYTGLGIEVEEQPQGLIIINTLQGSPAALSGLQAGDKLIAIDGRNIAKESLQNVSALLRAAKLATIKLTVERQLQQITLALQRQAINIDSVTGRLLGNGIGYLAISSFNNHSYHDVARLISMQQSEYGGALRGLIIDLRDNPGGTLSSAVAIADLFLNSGTIVTTKGRFFDANQAFTAQRGDILNGAPIAIMINGNSASAAEILAGALQDNRRALIMGTTSYGKGSVQSLIPIGDGNTALKLTTARYYTPSGQSIDGIGIKPDVLLEQEVLSQLSKAVIMNLALPDTTVEMASMLAKLDPLILSKQ
ncbi:S41 family peptidase [Pseudoalteromonas fenneropenaei]|uniref:S41 family peptidase n=1 Tax=Pseudoalteromonas fenneropenaei TaxID=1737459 RepID=A0ABV7CHD8_9GAMM